MVAVLLIDFINLVKLSIYEINQDKVPYHTKKFNSFSLSKLFGHKSPYCDLDLKILGDILKFDRIYQYKFI